MARTCNIPQKERYMRMAIGSVFVAAGFVIHRDTFTAVTMVAVGSAMTARASLGY